ncbi:hypothetical protein HanIR_Chr07g0305841 [Helianthus annuus]|nr:hypothetical protein HanIR_Chr07g0305841 [Helianthus annuus]
MAVGSSFWRRMLALNTEYQRRRRRKKENVIYNSINRNFAGGSFTGEVKNIGFLRRQTIDRRKIFG